MENVGETQLVYKFGPFIVNCRTYVLTKGVSRVRLPHSLMKLLMFFLEREGQLITRKQIAQVLWQEPEALDVDNGINTAVNRLRAALGDNPGKPIYIETVIGAGYRFIVEVKREEKAIVESAPINPRPPLSQVSASTLQEPAPESGPTPKEEREIIAAMQPASSDLLSDGQRPGEEVVTSPATYVASQRHADRSSAGRMFILGGCAISALLLLLWVWRVSLHSQQTHNQSLAPQQPLPNLSLVQATFNDGTLPVLISSVSPDGSMLAFNDAKGLTVRHLDRDADIVLPFSSSLLIRRIVWWSDNTGLLISCDAPDGKHQVWRAPIAPGPAQLLLEDASQATLSEDSKAIAFTRHGDSEIWTATQEGLRSHRLVSNDKGEPFSELTWVRDDHALFAEAREAIEDKQSTGTGNAGLTYRWKADIFAVPDGEMLSQQSGPRLAFAASVANEDLLFVAQSVENNRTTSTLVRTRLKDVAGTGSASQILIRFGGDEITGVSASADGRVVSIIRKRLSPAVFFGNVSQEAPAALEEVSRLKFVAPDTYPHAWLPSGKAIFFESNQSGPYTIYQQKLDGSPAEAFARSPFESAMPRVSPDGRWVIFGDFSLHPAHTLQAIYRVPVNGGQVEQVQTSFGLDSFDCSATSQGRCIERNRIGNQYIYFDLDPVLGQQKELLRTPWSPGALGDWTVSSDGKRVLTVTHDPLHPAIHFESLEKSNRPIPEILIATAGTPVLVREATDRAGFFVEARMNDQYSLLAVKPTGEASTLREGPLPIWGEPSRQGKLAFPFPAINTNVWILKPAP